MGDIKPYKTLLFVAGVMLLLGLVSYVAPSTGLDVSMNFKFRFPDVASVFKKKKEKIDISQIIKIAEEAEKDSLPEYGEADTTGTKLIKCLQFANKKRDAMDQFFYSLMNMQSQSKNIRILHYGDSQIEADRFSEYLRTKLQSEFGGSGPGLMQAIPVTTSYAYTQSWSSNWDRYHTFLFKDSRVPHNFYGVQGGFCRYKGYENVTDSTKPTEAWVKFEVINKSNVKLSNFNKIKLFYGNAKTRTVVSFYENNSLLETDTLSTGGYFNVKQFFLTGSPDQFMLRFKGPDSPDIYGISLEGDWGIFVDNMALRGSAGTFFHLINGKQLTQFYDYLNARLIILQFGGNALPAITTKEQALEFGSYLKGQMSILKNLAPKASILVIGPADMAVKVGTDYVTHPQLEDLRDAIKNAAMETNCAFWDMYDAMGGKNSMVSWVESDPPLAGTDYIHFTPQGARNLGVLLYQAIHQEYKIFLKKIDTSINADKP